MPPAPNPRCVRSASREPRSRLASPSTQNQPRGVRRRRRRKRCGPRQPPPNRQTRLGPRRHQPVRRNRRTRLGPRRRPPVRRSPRKRSGRLRRPQVPCSSHRSRFGRTRRQPAVRPNKSSVARFLSVNPFFSRAARVRSRRPDRVRADQMCGRNVSSGWSRGALSLWASTKIKLSPC
jgi:hypothetical protein